MCKYCYSESDFGMDSSCHWLLRTAFGKTFEGTPDTIVTLCRDEQDAWGIKATVDYEEHKTYDMKINIRFCPMCGRDLLQWEGEQAKKLKGD